MRVYTGKLPIDTGLGGHRNRPTCSVSKPSARPVMSMVGTLEVSYKTVSPILLLRGDPVGVVYIGKHNIHEVFPT